MGRRVNGWRLLVEGPPKSVVVPETVPEVFAPATPAPIPVHPQYEGEWAVRSTSDPTAYQMDDFTEAPARYSSRASAEGQIFRRGEWEAIPYPDWWTLRHPSGALHMTYRYYGDARVAREAEGLSECVIVAYEPTRSSRYEWVRRPESPQVWDCTLLGEDADILGWGHVRQYDDGTAGYWRDAGEVATRVQSHAEARAAIEALPTTGFEVEDGVVRCVYCGGPAAGNWRGHERCVTDVVSPALESPPSGAVVTLPTPTIADVQAFLDAWLAERAGVTHDCMQGRRFDASPASAPFTEYLLQRRGVSVWLEVRLNREPNQAYMRAAIQLQVNHARQSPDDAIRVAALLSEMAVDARELQGLLDAMPILPPGPPER